MLQESLYAFSRTLIRTFAGLALRFDLQRQAGLPAGPKLFAANHPSATDPFLIHLVSREQMHVMITRKAFRTPVFGTFLHKVGEIPVAGLGEQALEEARQALKEGDSVGIFPEGLISPADGGFMPPRSGAARLALSTGVPVVPVGIALQRDRCTKIISHIDGEDMEARWCLRGPYTVTVGEPVRFEGDPENRKRLREVSESIMERIRLLAYESECRLAGWKLAASCT
jgi:1-acyl-sn-glycerol-3-phosphate acyltransferase